jgi:hypothetical protein
LKSITGKFTDPTILVTQDNPEVRKYGSGACGIEEFVGGEVLHGNDGKNFGYPSMYYFSTVSSKPKFLRVRISEEGLS